jgi:ASC-1-like (ASCH) protein
MTIHQLSIQNPKLCPTFDLIKNGIKTVEGRKHSDKYLKYKVDDILIFHCNGQSLKTQIKYIRKI